MLHYIFSLPFLFVGLQAQELRHIAVGKYGNAFTPNVAYGSVGDIVAFEWFNGTHNVIQMNDDGCSNFTMDGITSGPPVEEPGKIFTFTLKEAGDFFYACQNHCELDGMHGTIVVSPATTTIPEPTATATATTTGMAPHRTLEPYPVQIDGAYPRRYANEQGGMYNFLRGLNFV